MILSDSNFVIGSGRIVSPSLLRHHLSCNSLSDVLPCENVVTTTTTHLEVMQIQNLVKGWPRSHALLSLLLLVCDLHLYFLDRLRVYGSQALKDMALGGRVHLYTESTHCFSLGRLVVMASGG
jgi:hypothetical protein